MRTVRILVLDTPGLFHRKALQEEGFTVELTGLEMEDTWSDEWGGYRISARAEQMASAATTADYDFVIIGNNRGHGFVLARELPMDLRSRTLVVWNSNSGQIEVPEYQELDYQHFGIRPESDIWVIEQLASQSV